MTVNNHLRSDRVRSKISVGSTGHPSLRCADCERIIEDDVLGRSPNYLEMIAQYHMCDEAEEARYRLMRTEYEQNWRKGKDGQ